jgi:hypothetical protein
MPFVSVVLTAFLMLVVGFYLSSLASPKAQKFLGHQWLAAQ